MAPGPLCPSEIYLPSRVFFFRSGFFGRSKIISGSGSLFIWGVKIIFRATFRSSFGVRFDKKCKHFSRRSASWSGGWAFHQLGTFPFFHHRKTTAPPCCPSRLHCQSVTKQGKSFALSVLIFGDGRPANKEIASFPLFLKHKVSIYAGFGMAEPEMPQKYFLLTVREPGSQVPRKDPRGCSQYLLPPALIPALPPGLPPAGLRIRKKAGYYNRFRYFLTGSVIMSRLSLLHPPAVVAPAPVAPAPSPFVWV